MVGVSVIIPYFNRPLKVFNAVESVKNQQVNLPLEIIIVDDASTVLPVGYTDKWSDLDYKWVRLEENVGASVARNIGVQNSSYNYLAFLDCDDEWKTNHLKSRFNGKKHASSFSFGSYDIISKNRTIGTRLIGDVKNENLIEYLFLSGGDMRTSTFLMKKELFNKVRFNPLAKKHQDWDFAIRASKYTTVKSYTSATVRIDIDGENRMSARSNYQASKLFFERHIGEFTPKTKSRFWVGVLYRVYLDGKELPTRFDISQLIRIRDLDLRMFVKYCLIMLK